MKTTEEHPNEFRAAQFTQAGEDLEITQIPWRDPAEGEVVVKVIACGVARSDTLTQNQELGSIQYPRTPGHELVGDVCAVGPNEPRWKIGDRVGGGWHAGHCMVCIFCRKGEFESCENEQINGINRDGGYAEYCVLRTEAVVAVPSELDPAETTAMMNVGVTIFNSLRNMEVHSGELVVIDGMGGLAQLAVHFSRQMGFRTVCISKSPNESPSFLRNLGLPELFGSYKGNVVGEKNVAGSNAIEIIESHKGNAVAEIKKMGGAKVIMCTTPAEKGHAHLVEGLQPDGQLVLLAYAAGTLPVPMMSMITRRLSLVGWSAGTAQDTEDCLKFALTHEIHAPVEKFSLDQCNDAWNKMIDPATMDKPVLMMQ